MEETLDEIQERMKYMALRASYRLAKKSPEFRGDVIDIFKYLTLLHSKEMNKIIDEETNEQFY
jgi:hypothetical protein